MKSRFIPAILFAVVCSCTPPASSYEPSDINVTSSNARIEKTFEWARDMVRSYAHDGSDPVGYWYEAALPSREAFCMRDVAHQTTGAWLLGLGDHNLNMMRKFVSNISESRDWCTFWEIDRYDRPCPADYSDDQNFWYNLNANFDVMQACLKMYRWTGDKTYVQDPEFVNFYDRSMDEYMETWSLTPDKIMERPVPHSCRGIASYVESRWDMRVSLDLLSTMLAGCRAYAGICDINGNDAGALKGRECAKQLSELIENVWWDAENNRYHNFWYEDNTFGNGEGSIFALWFDAASDTERIRSIAEICNSQFWNIENQSYMPAIMYRYGYDKEAYDNLTDIPGKQRCEYPEASYGVIEGIFGGLMGINPDFRTATVETRSHILEADGTVTVSDVPVFNGHITLTHMGRTVSELVNNTGDGITWRAAFSGEHATLYVDGKAVAAQFGTDPSGNPVSYVDVRLKRGRTSKVSVNG